MTDAPGPAPSLTIVLQRRPDGGLRVSSDDVPGLLLSGTDPNAIMADVLPAIEHIQAFNGKPTPGYWSDPKTFECDPEDGDEIVQRLRGYDLNLEAADEDNLAVQAADEIEQLRAELAAMRERVMKCAAEIEKCIIEHPLTARLPDATVRWNYMLKNIAAQIRCSVEPEKEKAG